MRSYNLIYIIIAVWLLSIARAPVTLKKKSYIQVFDAPKGTLLSALFKVHINTINVPVYSVKVGAADNTRRFKAVDDLLHSSDYFDTAAFCYFAIEGTAEVQISTPVLLKSVKILPASSHVKPVLHGSSLSFAVSKPQNLTIEINGDITHSLHVFINPADTYRPNLKDTNLVYFGPGIHYVTSMVIGDNKTVYVAGGAIIKAIVGNKEKFSTEPSGLRNYDPTFVLKGKHIRFLGQGIIDASACPTHSRSFLTLNGSDINLKGVILINSSGWTVPLWECNNVQVKNIKIIGYRANSDGIDICNSRNVIIDSCFIRTNDDLVVVKAFENKQSVDHVLVKNCVLWNQLAHALSIGAEIRQNINDVVFNNCDIIHDTGREWSLRIFQTDQATVSNVIFENLKIEESHNFISLWIGKLPASFNNQLGQINGVTFKNIYATGSPLKIELNGGDQDHRIKNVLLDRVFLNGIKITQGDIQKNGFIDEPAL